MSKKRQHLVDTAIALFSAHGFHGVGIDRIAEEAQVSKKTMYHHFRSKEDLIVAALKFRDRQFREDFMKGVEAAATTPRERLLAVFDVAQAWFSGDKFYGCMFINAVGEYSEPDTEIRGACREFKRQMREFIEGLAKDAGLENPQQVAAALSILLEGAIVTAQVSQDPDSAQVARRAAEALIGPVATGNSAARHAGGV